jgi:hypothetical protein
VNDNERPWPTEVYSTPIEDSEVTKWPRFDLYEMILMVSEDQAVEIVRTIKAAQWNGLL